MEEKEMFKATCSECGVECEVPFEPVKDRGVKCKDCFRKGRPQQGQRNNRDWKKNFDVKCAECGKDATVPFKPTEGRPVLCKECFRK
jgi:CxxC-x17-CxxC domain-containing protein